MFKIEIYFDCNTHNNRLNMRFKLHKLNHNGWDIFPTYLLCVRIAIKITIQKSG
jgi:hypothetical protein